VDFAVIAEQQWHIPLKHSSGEEYVGPCPFCHQATDDGFHVWAERGNYWCRKCGVKGWVSEDDREFTEQELTDLRLRALERRQEEQEKRLSALEEMHRCKDHLEYHNLLGQDEIAYWNGQGIYDAAIKKYLLGICYQCPLDFPKHRPSYTIPVINGGKLQNIRHRIIGADNGDKYRPHRAGLGATLFNADNLYNGEDTVLLLEGEKKAICLSQYGYNTVAIMGKSGFPPHWAKRFEPFKRVLVCLDPDALDQAHRLASLFNGRGYVVTLPEKPDDFFVKGGKPQEFAWFIKWAKEVRA